jgi:hypothetical protein
MPNLVTTAATTVGALDSGSITSGFGTIDTGSSNITTTGVGAFGSLDISGDIDVDGTTNLDVVDIDGAVDMATTLAVAGALTTGGAITTNGGNFIFNEDSADYDFRVESNGATHALFVDGGTNNVGIGANASNIPAATSNSSYKQLFVSTGGALVDSGGSGPSTQLLNNSYIGSGNNNYATATQVASRMNLTGGRMQFDTAPSVSADAQQTFTERLRIHTNGVASFNDGIALGVGLNNTASNVLDDYEEGTWDPVLTDGTNDATMHALTDGVYTKIGRAVIFSANVRTSSLGSVSGNINIKGLPFASANEQGNNSAASTGNAENLAITADVSITGFISKNGATVRLDSYDTTGGVSVLQASEFSADGQIAIGGTYATA